MELIFAIKIHQHCTVTGKLSENGWKLFLGDNKQAGNQKKIINKGRRYAIEKAYQASQTMNYVADIINFVIEDMRQNHYELPAFKELDRLVRHTRALVNQKLFKKVYVSFTPQQIKMLDNFLETKSYNRSQYNNLKRLPANPTITHFRELLDYYNWLVSLGNFTMLSFIPKTKFAQFAEEARSLDAGNMKQLNYPRRYALMACLIYQAQQRCKDTLATTFCKTIGKIHKNAGNKLRELRESALQKTNELLNVFLDILSGCENKGPSKKLSEDILEIIQTNGGVNRLREECEQTAAYNTNNHYPLLWRYFSGKRPVLFHLIQTLKFQSITQSNLLLDAMNIMLKNRHKKSVYIPKTIELSFISEQWKKLVFQNDMINRKYFEVCIFSYLANELQSGDLFIEGAETYADYRRGLLNWNLCEPLLKKYCLKIGIPSNAEAFIQMLYQNHTNTANYVDQKYPDLPELVIDNDGIPTLKKYEARKKPSSAVKLLEEINRRMPERNLMDILCSAHHYTGWADVFSPISGTETRIKNPIENYIVTSFAYGTGMGPTQAAQHIKPIIASAHTLSFINRHHVTCDKLDRANKELINCYNTFPVLKAWGDGKSCAADGTLHEIREDNLISEFHVRYNQTGGIAYHHVADNYIALFSTFIPCGVWEAVEIIEALLKNKSDIQPDTVHADTQGQSTVVFALAFLLGIKLMPRIRHWKNLKFFRPNKNSHYKNIDSLFNEEIDWQLIETYWKDMMQVALSIQEGKITSSLLLRRLNTYSRKNRLYLAFRELGRVIRTQFLLEYISDVQFRRIITEQTNKVEAYHKLSDWSSFGSTVLVASNDTVEMEKAVKYNDIVNNSIMLQNVIDISLIIQELKSEGWDINKGDVSFLSPYLTGHIKRFGNYIVDLNGVIAHIGDIRNFTLWKID